MCINKTDLEPIFIDIFKDLTKEQNKEILYSDTVVTILISSQNIDSGEIL